MMGYDILIKKGQIIDGSGNPWFRADIGIKDGFILEIGNLDCSANRIINAEGLFVAPGFIDIHSHADMQLSSPRQQEIVDCFVHQGITTVITGNCGFSHAPLPKKLTTEFKDYVSFATPSDITWEWNTFCDWLDYLEKQGVLLNVAPLVGHLPIRISAMGFERREPTPKEQQKMQILLSDSLKAGAFGFSVGLVYLPSFCAKITELIALAETVSSFKALYAGHFRGYSETLIQAINEFIDISHATGARMQISHLHAMGKAYWPEIPRSLKLIENARQDGIDIAYDAIPICTGTTMLSRLFPFKYLEGGLENFLTKLADPNLREQIRQEVEEPKVNKSAFTSSDWWENFVELLGYDNLKLMIPSIEEDKDLIGISFSEIARLKGVSPFQAMVDLTIRERGEGLLELVGVSGDKPDSKALLECLADKNGVISTDAIVTGNGPGNPTSYGAFARVIGYYARDLSIFSLEEAVRKITSFPAQRAGLKGRGYIFEGVAADITIFDYNKIKDTSTSSNPANHPEGIEYVLINGQLIKEGKNIDLEHLAGKVLRRR